MRTLYATACAAALLLTLAMLGLPGCAATDAGSGGGKTTSERPAPANGSGGMGGGSGGY
ncbi:MAG: hypothetical protein JSR21_18600 [Proteobacteria bacterium]|nr:hypothetical protein [Pseudomonadota bacterium]